VFEQCAAGVIEFSIFHRWRNPTSTKVSHSTLKRPLCARCLSSVYYLALIPELLWQNHCLFFHCSKPRRQCWVYLTLIMSYITLSEYHFAFKKKKCCFFSDLDDLFWGSTPAAGGQLRCGEVWEHKHPKIYQQNMIRIFLLTCRGGEQRHISDGKDDLFHFTDSTFLSVFKKQRSGNNIDSANAT